MTTVDQLRNNVIDRILTIENRDFLIALEKLISASIADSEEFTLTKEQELMLQMSEDDILNGRTISQHDLEAKTKIWLENKKS